MVKTRRSNGENGEVDEGQDTLNDVGSVSDEKASNWSQRELRSSQYKVTRKIPRWPTVSKYRQRRLRAIKMSRISVFPESDTEPEKYSKRSRKVRVFFADDNDGQNRSVRGIRRRDTRKNSAEDSEDKPIQQNVRRSCRKRKLLHHNFNESWITNELKVKGYPDLYGYPGFTSSEDFSSGDEARVTNKKMAHRHVPTNTDEDTQLSRTRRTSARFTNNKKIVNGSESEDENNQTVIEKKPAEQKKQEEKQQKNGEEKMETEENQEKKAGEVKKENGEGQDSERNQVPARTTRRRGRRRKNLKEDSHQESELSSSESGSEITLTRQPRRSNRTRQAKPAFVQIAPRERETRGRAKTFTIRKKPYCLRERKPKILRRKTIRSQSPSSSSSSSSSDSEDTDLNVSMKNKSKGRQKSKASTDDKRKEDRALRDIQPIELDGSVRFSSVGGLEEHIKCLREMVLFPLMYPDLFAKFNTRPAKGVLFHGPPGTGKTLLARALANECSLVGGRKVAFFMRKGADCLKKWVGESERNLKLLFQQANKMKPSIIFFDEIDALAPVRSVRQDQVHASVVGTLLAEMDGVCDRGEVVIIGATNRLDAVDPALRRAGRFDRELHFPPPHAAARRDILEIYTKDWQAKPSEETILEIAQTTSGYGGSDLKALCSEAVLKALRRVYPQVYESEHALIIDAKNVEVTKQDLSEAMKSLVAAGARATPLAAKTLPRHCQPLLQPQLQAATQLLNAAFPPTHQRRHGDITPSVLLLSGECAETFLAPALLAQLEHCTVKELNMATLHSVHAFTQEQSVISLFSECRRADRGCVLFVRDIVSVWGSLASSPGAGVGAGGAGAAGGGAALLLQLWRTRAAGDHTLLLATSGGGLGHGDLPPELQNIFPAYKDCVYRVREPNASEVIAFLKPIITEVPLEPPIVENNEPPPPLPRAPPPPPPRESEEEIARRKRKEDYKLRELRIFLRDICRKLASNRRFYKFTKPVDLEEVTDYLDIIKQPMDLETMMTKVDQHKYNCAREFLDDVDLICANALEYNPDRTSSDKQIRHEACSLRDHAHALIDVEMDSDFELDCQDIARKRKLEGEMDHDLPDFIYTASNIPHSFTADQSENKSAQTPQNGDKSEPHSGKRKRRRINAWSKGLVVKRPRTTPKTCKENNLVITDEESKENKPITSTPLPNGEALVSSSSGSDDDAPLRRPQDDSLFNLSAATVVNNHVLESKTTEKQDRHIKAVLLNPIKNDKRKKEKKIRHCKVSSTSSVINTLSPARSTDRLPTKNSPKKRNSGHEVSSDTEKVLINKTELDNVLYKNAKSLRAIGLEALIDLHSQISKVVNAFARQRDRTKLPQELNAIVARYVQLAKK